MSEKIFTDLKDAIVNLSPDAAEDAANAAIEAKISPVEAIEKGLSEGMTVIGDLFDVGDIFMPEMLIAAEAFQKACDILQAGISKEDAAGMKNGKVILYTVEGDIHDIGKNIVSTMLDANNFEIKDLGRDVEADVVIEEAMAWGADIIAGSALMTTTMPAQRDIIESMKEQGVRDKFKVIFGGAPVSEEWCNEIGADGFGENAATAVKLAKELMKGKVTN